MYIFVSMYINFLGMNSMSPCLFVYFYYKYQIQCINSGLEFSISPGHVAKHNELRPKFNTAH